MASRPLQSKILHLYPEISELFRNIFCKTAQVSCKMHCEKLAEHYAHAINDLLDDHNDINEHETEQQAHGKTLDLIWCLECFLLHQLTLIICKLYG